MFITERSSHGEPTVDYSMLAVEVNFTKMYLKRQIPGSVKTGKCQRANTAALKIVEDSEVNTFYQRMI